MIRLSSTAQSDDVRIAPIPGQGGEIQPCLEEDIPQVANLHARVFYQSDRPASEGLRAYYRDVFFRNPWRDEELPSLVYRSGGRVIGFMGVIPRRMVVQNTPIRAAVAHRLMVMPDSGMPLAAAKLVKRFFAGPQVLSISDGANGTGRRFWEGLGGTTALLHSLHWVRLLRPARYTLGLLQGDTAGALWSAAAWPVCRLADLFLSRFWGGPLPDAPPDVHEYRMDEDVLLACTSAFAAQRRIRPVYDRSDLSWLWTRLRENRNRGDLRGFAVNDRQGRLLGGFLYYLKARTLVEVVYLAASEDTIDVVLTCLFRRARQEGAAGLQGQLDPRFLNAHLGTHCLFKRGCWTLIHARDPELLDCFRRGDVFLSALEGELWLHGPKVRL